MRVTGGSPSAPLAEGLPLWTAARLASLPVVRGSLLKFFSGGASLSRLVRASGGAAVQRATAVIAVLTMVLMGLAGAPAEAATGDRGFEGPSFSGTARPASADKPESKLWYAHGRWWAVMWDTNSADWHIFRLVRSAHRWVDTGVLVDKRRGTLADVLYQPGVGKLFVASHVVTKGIALPGNDARLMRYSYVRGTWKLDAGFPTKITSYSSESMTIDKDSVGNLWASWTQVAAGRTNGAVYVARGSKGGAAWGKPFLVPAADRGGNRPRPDDISTVVSFGNRIGVLWSNQTTSAFYWSVHRDGASNATWSRGVALKSPAIADDHINIKSLQSDGTGRVYAVLRTNLNDVSTKKSLPQVILASYSPGAGWRSRTVWKIGDCVTRPIVVLNKSTQRVYVMATAPGTGCKYAGERGVIVQKSASLANPSFPSGRGKI